MFSESKVVFEIHKTDKLSNRFKSSIPIPSEAVLSIDDDLIIPCTSLSIGFGVWLSNQR